MALQEPLPESVQRALADISGQADGAQVAVSTDIDSDGNFGERWLVATSDRAYVFVPDGDGAEVLQDVPISQIREVKTDYLVGNGVLEVDIDGKTVHLLHYTNSLAPKFARVARHLEALAKNEDPPVYADEDKKRCENCGRLFPDGTTVCPACLNKRKVLRRLMGFVKPYWPQATLVTALMLLGTGVGLVSPSLMKPLYDDVLNNQHHWTDAHRLHVLKMIVLSIIGLRILSWCIGVYRGRVAAWLGGRMTLDIRTALWQTLQRLSLSYFDKRQLGAIMARVTQDTNALQNFIVDGLQYFVISVLQLAVICSILFWWDWKLALYVILPAPIVGTLSYVFARRMFMAFHKYWRSLSGMAATLNDSLSGIRVVRAFAQEDREINRFNAKSNAVFSATLNAEQFVATFWPTMTILTEIGSFIVYWVGGSKIIHGEEGLTSGLLLVFLSYMGMFYGPLQMLTRITDWMSRCLTATERIFEVLDTNPEVADASDAVKMKHMRGEIEFRDVTFGYEKHKPVLHNVSVKINAGEMIGLVGHSGAGKSTLINMICRFYDADEGIILIDGVDIRKIRMRDLRNQIGVVLQEPFLFNGTIAENIAYSKPGASREEIIRSAKAANAHDFIMKLPDGYDSPVGERGGRLSGGERQRISIARAILHDPKILILDEATSSVDTETEKQIQEALGRLVKNRTTFAIAHRLSTLKNSDRLIVVEEGRISEMGTHDELLEKKGTYWRLVEIQTELSKIRAIEG